MNVNQRSRPNPAGEEVSESGESGILNERILMLVFESINWDPHLLCRTACVSRKLHALAKRLLWRQLCISRAPRMAVTLVNGLPNGHQVGGGWHVLAKLLFFCGGCESSRHFRVNRSLPGHFSKTSRFSKTSGRSFLTKKCREDLLYVSDPCEHPMEGHQEDLGVYRGVFRGFRRSKTRDCLIGRRVELEEGVRCPYCGARVWSMTTARLVPKSAWRRLGSHDGALEYFVCVNGHLHGFCWLAPLSSDEDNEDDDHEVDDNSDDGFHQGVGYQMDIEGLAEGRSISSSSGEKFEDGPTKV
ncbi:EID1-like F-box protein 3 [Macadamia integrifolia]|uniref:EID1-like F-box protein 3 n=1 Tax=Macadamia integrifolia TaxID=60698 RepID=UPI001C4E60B0|nr:EID1-like F-box protein 3 [Macadamia integrifolia]